MFCKIWCAPNCAVYVYFYCSTHIKVWLDSLMNSLVAPKLMTFLMKVCVLYPGYMY